MVEFERDIWVVKCRFSLKTDRTATQQSCALDHPAVARTIEAAVWWAGRITKALPDKKPSLNDVIPAGASAQSGDLPPNVRNEVPDRLPPSGMTAVCDARRTRQIRQRMLHCSI